MEIKELTNMELHETKTFMGGLSVLKVPGGWIYTKQDQCFCNGVGEQWMMTSTFVPDLDSWNKIIDEAVSRLTRKTPFI